MPLFKPLEFEEALVQFAETSSVDYCYTYSPDIDDINKYVQEVYMMDSDYSYQSFELGDYLYYIIFDYKDSLRRVLRFKL